MPPIDEPSASTPQRQPVPSTGSPPPTPSGSAARANPLVEPTATPAPAVLKEAIATAIAALTPAIQGIPNAIAKSPTVQAANKETTEGAVCEDISENHESLSKTSL